MKNRVSIAIFILAAVSLSIGKSAVDVNGSWTGEVRGEEGGIGRIRFVLQQDGDRISGTAGPLEKENRGRIYDAKLDGRHLTFAADDTDESEGLTLTYHFDVTVTNGQMQGKAHGRSGDRSWTLDISMTRDK